MYIVRFVRKDRQPDEEYYYRSLKDAEYHLSLFEDDDSGLYDRIELIDTEKINIEQGAEDEAL